MPDKTIRDKAESARKAAEKVKVKGLAAEREAEVKAATIAVAEPTPRTKQSLLEEAAANEAVAEKHFGNEEYELAETHWENARICYEAAKNAPEEE